MKKYTIIFLIFWFVFNAPAFSMQNTDKRIILSLSLRKLSGSRDEIIFPLYLAINEKYTTMLKISEGIRVVKNQPAHKWNVNIPAGAQHIEFLGELVEGDNGSPDWQKNAYVFFYFKDTKTGIIPMDFKPAEKKINLVIQISQPEPGLDKVEFIIEN